jgi:hypothetical protein
MDTYFEKPFYLNAVNVITSVNKQNKQKNNTRRNLFIPLLLLLLYRVPTSYRLILNLENLVPYIEWWNYHWSLSF